MAKSIDDVRKKLWGAYERLRKEEGGIEGKSSEARVLVKYLPIWEAKTLDEFLVPYEIEIYSYSLGPSRRHFFTFDEEYSKPDYNAWRGPNICQLACDAIDEWEAEYFNDTTPQ